SQGTIEMLSELCFACGFILLTLNYHPKKYNIIAIGSILVVLFFAIIRARRSLLFMYGNMILFSYLLFVFRSKKMVIILFYSFLFLLLATFYIQNIYKVSDNRFIGFL